MILCHCHVVNDQAVIRAVGDGARTVAEICRVTGAGRSCGRCVLSVRRVLRPATEQLATTGDDPLG